MKQSILQVTNKVISATMAIVIAMSLCAGFPSAVYAETENHYVVEWDPADEIKASIKSLAGGVPKDQMFMYESDYYGYKGIYSTGYSETDLSFVDGVTDGQGQYWKSRLIIPSSVDYDGFRIYSSSANSKGIAFTAPVPGTYKFFGESLGLDLGSSSIYANSGSWTVNVRTDSETYFETTVSSGEKADFGSFTLHLNKGDVLHVGFIAPGYKDNGYLISANFGIWLVEEEKSLILVKDAVYEDCIYTAGEYLTKVDSDSFTTDYDVSPFSIIGGSANDDLATWKKAPAKNPGSYVWYSPADITSWGDSGYSVLAYHGSDTVQFNCKHPSYSTAVVFTAPRDGEYTFYSSAVSFGGGGSKTFTLLDNDRNALANIGSSLNYTLSMKANEKVYYFFRRTSTDDWKTAQATMSDFKVTSKELKTPAVYDEGYVYTKTADEYINGADIHYTASGDLELSLSAYGVYDYEVLYNDGEKFVPMEPLGKGKYTLLNAQGNYADIYIRAYKGGELSAETYLTYVYRTDKIYSFRVLGKSVFDTAFADIKDGFFDISVNGQNVSYSYKNSDFAGISEGASITETVDGVYKLVFRFEDYERKVEVIAYNSTTPSFSENTAGYASYSDGKLTLSSVGSAGALYSFSLKSYSGEEAASVPNQTKKTAEIEFSDYGIYFAEIGIKNTDLSENTSVYRKQIEIKRPGGEWSLTANVDGSFGKEVYATAGVRYRISAEATFAGEHISSTEYAFYLKSGNELSLIKDYSSISSADFIPEGSGVYEIIAAVKGEGASSAEAVSEITVIVPDNAYNGNLTISKYEFQGLGKIARIEAQAENNAYDTLYYRFYAEYEDSLVMIKDYSVDNFAEFIPTRSEHFNVRVEIKNQNCGGAYDKFAEYKHTHTCIQSEALELITPTFESDGLSVTCCTVCGKQLSLSVLDRLIVEEISILSLPNKINYSAGESFDHEGLVIRVTYTNSTRIDTFDEFKSEDFTYLFNKNGENEVTLDFYGYEVKFNVIVNKPNLTGDANGDESVDVNDAMLIMSYIAGYDVAVTDKTDVNSNGTIDIGDAVLILQYIVGYDLEYFK